MCTSDLDTCIVVCDIHCLQRRGALIAHPHAIIQSDGNSAESEQDSGVLPPPPSEHVPPITAPQSMSAVRRLWYVSCVRSTIGSAFIEPNIDLSAISSVLLADMAYLWLTKAKTPYLLSSLYTGAHATLGPQVGRQQRRVDVLSLRCTKRQPIQSLKCIKPLHLLNYWSAIEVSTCVLRTLVDILTEVTGSRSWSNTLPVSAMGPIVLLTAQYHQYLQCMG